MRHPGVVLGGATAIAVILGTTGAAAAAPVPATGSAVVIADGLDNPRGMIVSPDGSVLVAEAGRGGDGPCAPSRPDPTVPACLGATGAITVLRPGRGSRSAGPNDGIQWNASRVVTGLPSLAQVDGSDAIGPHDIALAPDGRLYGVVGGAGTPEIRETFGPGGALLGHAVVLVALKASEPEWRAVPIADLNTYEAEHNPDQGDPNSTADSNPIGIVATARGLAVLDAGGNDLLRVTKRGAVSTAAVFHARQVLSEDGSEVSMQTVPTALTRGPDGALYVGEFTGRPYPVGGARVWRVSPGQPPAVVAAGFTNIMDIAFDRTGRLLVLEMSRDGFPSTTGALTRVDLTAGGTRTELVPGTLTSPIGLAVGPDNAIYVTNRSRTAGQGQVLRIRA